ncbi:MAG: GrpB family protein [Nanoarchaeota archaeon]|nr:GrpB family protein [Nanoarchaeota archaeon]
MSYYIIIRGPLGIGKSTISKELAEELNAKYVSMDKILEENNLEKVSKRQGCIPARNFIKADNIILPKLKKALSSGKIVILDGCFYHKEQIEHLNKSLKFMHYAFNLKAPLSVCIDRDRKRPVIYGKDAAKAVYSLVSKFEYGVNLNTENKSSKNCVKEIIDYIKAYAKAHSFNEYNPNVIRLFENEKEKSIKILGKKIKIEHVGSTAVPGLGGKGIIDIAIFTPKNKLKTYTLRLRELGFEERPNHPGNDKRVFMLRVIKENGKERRVHVHLCLTDEFWNSFIIFRDYLRANREARDEYARIKKEGAKYSKGDGKKYMDYKSNFLKKTVKKALKEIK